MTTLADRIRDIISENQLKQKDFASSINVSESYISQLLHGASGLSNSTATLIAERYGYSLAWILDGEEPKISQKSKSHTLAPLQRKIISEIEQMDEADLIAVKIFIRSMGEYKAELGLLVNRDPVSR
ncbi:XRE family transcriptional regulator [Pseudoflavonifractor sp. 524-17]|uniref:helix-turn-helix domain-containing protein n=1 Tax=Pseudoflavonifractor sp. 524-17 TaxID=2304577 RepID=UPI0013798173|nr:helix-turn-helix transcriptional regulator [Pseudoflavonifractor sp. 524-17]NCE63197.1 XRE family transcriptional regulator [Pseudoflavonifractor sp. 524-17]